MIMNTAVAVAVTELFVISREADLPFIVLAQCWRLKVSKNVSVSALQGLGLVAKIRRLGLVELYEGFGPGLVSDQKPNVSVSSRSGKLRSRLHPCHAVLPRSKQTPCQVNHHRKYLSEIQW